MTTPCSKLGVYHWVALGLTTAASLAPSLYTLQQAGFRLEKNPDYQALEINDAETLKCLMRFGSTC